MADIFLSYTRADRTRAERVAQALRSAGFDVWLDKDIDLATRFREEIDQQLDAAKCVVVLWSITSIRSDWVLDEAQRGKGRGVLIQALIDPVRLPIGFGEIQAADLVDWQPDAESSEFRRLRDAITRMVGRHDDAPAFDGAPGGEARVSQEARVDAVRGNANTLSSDEPVVVGPTVPRVSASHSFAVVWHRLLMSSLYGLLAGVVAGIVIGPAGFVVVGIITGITIFLNSSPD